MVENPFSLNGNDWVAEKGQTLSALSARQRADRVFESKIGADRVLGRIGFEGSQESGEEGRTGWGQGRIGRRRRPKCFSDIEAESE